VTKVRCLLRRAEWCSLTLGFVVVVFLFIFGPALADRLFLLGVGAGVANLRILKSTVEHGLRPTGTDRVQVFFLACSLARYVIVLLIFFLVARFAPQGLWAVVVGFLFPQTCLWLNCLIPLGLGRKQKG
jgi:hypothetical protein